MFNSAVNNYFDNLEKCIENTKSNDKKKSDLFVNLCIEYYKYKLGVNDTNICLYKDCKWTGIKNSSSPPELKGDIGCNILYRKSDNEIHLIHCVFSSNYTKNICRNKISSLYLFADDFKKNINGNRIVKKVIFTSFSNKSIRIRNDCIDQFIYIKNILGDKYEKFTDICAKCNKNIDIEQSKSIIKDKTESVLNDIKNGSKNDVEIQDDYNDLSFEEKIIYIRGMRRGFDETIKSVCLLISVFFQGVINLFGFGKK